MTRAVAIALVAIAAAFAGAALAKGKPDSGVRGDVHTSPTCGGPESIPPRPGCEPRPYETVVSIRELPDGELVKKVRSGKRGRFQARLEPGRYRLRARGGKNGGLPACSSEDVTVKAHQFATVHLGCDTGIR
jgi:hypothetical protein